jgi:hypothetical protein
LTCLYVTGTYSFGVWISHRTTVQVHLLQRSRFGKQRKQLSAVTWWKGTRRLAARCHRHQHKLRRTPRRGTTLPPLETGLRQRGDVESQRAAEAKAARDTALTAFNRERRQERLRTAQELAECLGSGLDLLLPEQVAQITEAAAAASSEPREALRSFGERLRDLRKENPQASEADLKEAVKGAVQAMIAKARGQRQRAETQRVAAESGTPRDVTRFPETRRMTRQDVPGPPSGRMLRGEESEVEQLHNYISRICTRRSGTATWISSGVTAELCTQGSHGRTRRPTERQAPGDGTPRRSTA